MALLMTAVLEFNHTAAGTPVDTSIIYKFV
jgi:hypothetical protein